MNIDVFSKLEESEKNKHVLPFDMYARLARRFSCLWETRDRGDCQVRVHFTSAKNEVTRKRTRSEALDSHEEQPSHVVMCHSAVLSASSDYFFKRLQSGTGSSDGGRAGRSEESSSLQYADGKEGGLTVLLEHINEEDVASFERMIKFFYQAEMDDSLDIADLLKLLQVADRFGATECCAAVRHFLVKKASGDICDSDLSTICDFEPANADDWSAVEATTQKQLICKFGVIYDTISNETLLDRWCKLSWKAVRQLLTCSDLTTDAEETIACLLVHWLNKQMDLKKLSDSDKEIIAEIELNLLRYGQMSVPFFSILIDSCPWLVLAQRYASEVHRYISLEPQDDEKNYIPGTFKSPSIWYKPRSNIRPATLPCVLPISESEFRRSIEQYPNFPRKVSPVYIRGWHMTMSVETNKDKLLCVFVSLKVACPVPIQSAQVVIPKCYITLNSEELSDPFWEPGKGIGYFLSRSRNWGDPSKWPAHKFSPDFSMLFWSELVRAY